MSLEAEARESDGAKAPSLAKDTEGEAEASRSSEAEVVEAGASAAEVADVGAPKTIEAKAVEAKAPETTDAEVAEASLGMVEPTAQDAETRVGQGLVLPLVQYPLPSQESSREVEVHLISSDDASWGKEVADAEAASTVENLALASGEGSSALVQAVLKAEIGVHNVLQSAARTVCEALEVEGVESGSSLRSRLIAVDLEAVSDGYVLAEDDKEADEEVMKLMEVAKGPGMALAKLFEEEVVPPTSSIDAGDPEP
ncbi:uncharacterized protein [Miscanthus floridulus]|uniref:uncharacterized protein n=1 Tax=Miscanthus floridulus TaxID=154761 RepID=UPI003459E018